jgi:DNA-binding NarL/FixJ family response regulator
VTGPAPIRATRPAAAQPPTAQIQPAPIRVALADDHTLFREGVREMLSAADDITVVGEAATGQGAVSLALTQRPDVLLLDIEMLGPGPAAVIRQVSGAGLRTRVIVLTMHDEPEAVQDLLDCGAAAYLIKTILRDELIAAVRSVVRWPETVLPSAASEPPAPTEGPDDHPDPAVQHPPLTDRELEVLRLTAEALSNAQIGSRLHITSATVKRHLTNVYAKLDAVSRVDAVRRATAYGLIESADRWRPPGTDQLAR